MRSRIILTSHDKKLSESWSVFFVEHSSNNLYQFCFQISKVPRINTQCVYSKYSIFYCLWQLSVMLFNKTLNRLNFGGQTRFGLTTSATRNLRPLLCNKINEYNYLLPKLTWPELTVLVLAVYYVYMREKVKDSAIQKLLLAY